MPVNGFVELADDSLLDMNAMLTIELEHNRMQICPESNNCPQAQLKPFNRPAPSPHNHPIYRTKLQTSW